MILENLPKYISERDGIKLGTNIPETSKQCFASSCTMLCNFMGTFFGIPAIKRMSLDEYNRVLSGALPVGMNFEEGRYLWTSHEKIMNAMIGPFIARTSACTYEKIRKQIDSGFPVVMGIDIQIIFGASRSLGHIVLCVGYGDHGLYFHDPYGDATEGYKNHDGETVFYSYDFLVQLLPLHFPMLIIKRAS